MFARNGAGCLCVRQERGSGESKISSRLKLATGCAKMRMNDDASLSRKASNLCCHLGLVAIASSYEALTSRGSVNTGYSRFR